MVGEVARGGFIFRTSFNEVEVRGERASCLKETLAHNLVFCDEIV